jgi:anti-sigma factor RsiW
MGGVFDRERFRRDHRWAPDRMSDYVDGELAPSACSRMERHLGRCESCRRLLDGLRRTVDALHRVSAPSGGVDSVMIAASVQERLDEVD